MLQNFSERSDLNLSQQRRRQWLKTALILFPGVILATDLQLIYAEKPKTPSPASREGTSETSTENRQSNPQIIMSVPPKWAETYKQETRKATIYDTHEKKGNEYLKEGKYDLALAEFETTLQLAGKYDMIGIMSAHRNLAKTYEAMATYPDTLTHIQFLIEHTQSDVARSDYVAWKRAVESAERGELGHAVQIYETLLAKAEDWERPQIQQRLDAMRVRANAESQKTPAQSNNVTADTALITDYIVSEFKKETGIDLRNQEMAYQRIHEAAEKAGVQLQALEKTEVNLPFIAADQSGPKHISMTIKREDLRRFASGKTE